MGRAAKRQQQRLEELERIASGSTANVKRTDIVEEDPDVGEGEDGDEDNDEAVLVKGSSGFSAFGALAQDDIADQEDESEEQEASSTQTKAKPKKKKKKKKKSNAGTISATPEEGQEQEDASEPVQGEQAGTPKVSAGKSKKAKGKGQSEKGGGGGDEDLDEIDRALKELSTEPGWRPVTRTRGGAKEGMLGAFHPTLKALLSVDSKHLDADAELRKMFGSKVVAATQAATPPPVRGMYRSAMNNPHHSASPLRSRSLLAKPEANWYPVGAVKGGLEMSRIQVDDLVPGEEGVGTGPSDESWFTYKHGRYYKEVTGAFLEAVASMDPNRIFAVLQLHPYHTDALLQLSEVAAHQGDSGQSADFLNRALYAFERAFGGGFNVTNGLSRLSFSRIENRSFYRALDRKVASLAKRGCWRTAFEFSKLLLSLDPYDDPYGSLLYLDFLAPKAKQYTWFLEFLEVSSKSLFAPSPPGEVEENQQLRLDAFPGMAFAKAWALWQVEAGQKKDHEGSTDALRSAILKFPMVIPLLFDKLGVNPPKQFAEDWRTALQSTFSKTPSYPIHLLSHLYVHRSSDLWKEPEVLSWLQSVTRSPEVADRLADETVEDVRWGIEASGGKDGKGLGLWPKGAIPAGWLRHVLVADIPSLRAFLPPRVTASQSFSYDPLPPISGTYYDANYFSEMDSPSQTSRRNQRRMMVGERGGGPAGGAGAPGMDDPRMWAALQAIAEQQGMEGLVDEQGNVRMDPEALQDLMAGWLAAQGGQLPGGLGDDGLEEEDEAEEEQELDEAGEGGEEGRAAAQGWGAWLGGMFGGGR